MANYETKLSHFSRNLGSGHMYIQHRLIWPNWNLVFYGHWLLHNITVESALKPLIHKRKRTEPNDRDHASLLWAVIATKIVYSNPLHQIVDTSLLQDGNCEFILNFVSKIKPIIDLSTLMYLVGVSRFNACNISHDALTLSIPPSPAFSYYSIALVHTYSLLSPLALLTWWYTASTLQYRGTSITLFRHLIVAP